MEKVPVETEGFSVKDIVEATGGNLVRGSRGASFSGISIDSRRIAPGELFWAIRGERFNGGDFISDALSRGAAGVVTDNGVSPGMIADDLAMIKVASSLEALQALAAFNRRRHPVPLVAITGSNGKTTTKEILVSILKNRYEVLKNEGNLNNHIGVPLTLLKLHTGHEVAVIELGMNRRGEIRELARMARPDFGVITNIGEAHLETLGSVENVRRAKGELVEAMADEDTVVLNADDGAVMELGRFAKGDVVTFGIGNGADIMASDVEVERGKGTLFMLSADGKIIPVLLPIYGIHQLYSALAASAVAYRLGLDLHEIREGLEEYEPYSGRMEIISERGVTIINDSYNANPPSVRYAIETMAKLAPARRIAVLGDMLEMGERGEELHAGVGEFASRAGIDLLVTVGPLARRLGEGALNKGMGEDRVNSFDDRSDAAEYLKGEIREGDWLLVKGSRGMRMEEVVSAMLDYLKADEGGVG